MYVIILSIIILFFTFIFYQDEPKILIMRHSEREDAVNPTWTSDHPYDTPITSNRKFFEKSIKKINMKIFKNSKIYCSPFKRCIQTAQIISEIFNPKLEICLELALIEVSSMEFYISSSSYFNNEEIYKRHKDVNFNKTYVPFFNKYDLEIFYKTNPDLEHLQKKMKNFLKDKDSCICVAHREFINIVDPLLPDGYCSTALVNKNLK